VRRGKIWLERDATIALDGGRGAQKREKSLELSVSVGGGLNAEG